MNSCFSVNGKLISEDSVDGDESDSEDDDDDDAEGIHFYYFNRLNSYGTFFLHSLEYDDETEIEINGGNELRDPSSKNILDEKIDGLSDRIGDREYNSRYLFKEFFLKVFIDHDSNIFVYPYS